MNINRGMMDARYKIISYLFKDRVLVSHEWTHMLDTVSIMLSDNPDMEVLECIKIVRNNIIDDILNTD